VPLLGRIVTLSLLISYPVIVFLSLRYWGIAGLGIATLFIGGCRLIHTLFRRSAGDKFDFFAVLILATGLVVLWSGEDISARLYPVIVNSGMLAYFGWTLAKPPSAVERLARLTDPNLAAHAVIYTRRVTIVWCVFFLTNASIALYTTLRSTIEIWTLYNGVIAYVAMGLLFFAEYIVRRLVIRRYESSHE